MTSRHGVRLLALVTAGLMVQACAAPPQKEMDQARHAIQAARSAGAEQYAAEAFAAATAALRRSEDAAAQRDYRLALTQALDASERAQDAVKTAAVQQSIMRTGADSLVGELTATVDRAKEAIKAAEATRPSRATRLAISDARRTIVVANVALQEAREALGQQDYRAARAACEGVAGKLDATIRALSVPSPAFPARRRD